MRPEPGARVAMFSARFDGGATEQRFRRIHEILAQSGYDISDGGAFTQVKPLVFPPRAISAASSGNGASCCVFAPNITAR